MNTSVAVVILNWNGVAWLEKFLPSVCNHLPHYANLYVADNASTDESFSFLKSNYPTVEIIQLATNLGFASGYNQALKSVNEDIYILLNSDIEIKSNWIEPVVEYMEENPEIAVCQPKILDQQSPQIFEYAGASGGFIDYLGFPFCRGRIFNDLEYDENQYDIPVPIFWATGACMFIKKEVYWKAGGLDDDYFAHMEEIDLCWRIKKMGYQIYAVPQSKVYHVGGGTLKKVSPQKTYLNFRNNLVTLIKNSPTKGIIKLVFLKLLFDGIAGIKFTIDGDFKHCLAIVRAHFYMYFNLGKILKKRKVVNSITVADNVTEIYNKSIVIKHFAKGVKLFSDLKSEHFSN